MGREPSDDDGHNEPKLGPAIDVCQQISIQHAYEVAAHWSNKSGRNVAAGTALEVLMIQWSGIPAEAKCVRKKEQAIVW